MTEKTNTKKIDYRAISMEDGEQLPKGKHSDFVAQERERHIIIGCLQRIADAIEEIRFWQDHNSKSENQ